MIGTLVRNTLHESLNRRGGLVLLLGGMAIPFMIWLSSRFAVENGITVIYTVGSNRPEDAIRFAGAMLGALISVANDVWLPISVFALSGLMTTPLEKGYLEMLLARPLGRMRLLAGRTLGIILLSYLSIALMLVPLVSWFYAHVSFPLEGKFRALGVILLVYLIMISIMQLLAVLQPNPAVVVLASYAMFVVSGALRQRETMASLIDALWFKKSLEYIYYLMPKFPEMSRMVSRLSGNNPVDSWMPLWSSLLFALGCWVLTAWTFQRRSY